MATDPGRCTPDIANHNRGINASVRDCLCWVFLRGYLALYFLRCPVATDRFLFNCRKDCKKIGLNFFKAISEIDDVHQFDVALDTVIYSNK